MSLYNTVAIILDEEFCKQCEITNQHMPGILAVESTVGHLPKEIDALYNATRCYSRRKSLRHAPS